MPNSATQPVMRIRIRIMGGLLDPDPHVNDVIFKSNLS